MLDGNFVVSVLLLGIKLSLIFRYLAKGDSNVRVCVFETAGTSIT